MFIAKVEKHSCFKFNRASANRRINPKYLTYCLCIYPEIKKSKVNKAILISYVHMVYNSKKKENLTLIIPSPATIMYGKLVFVKNS